MMAFQRDINAEDSNALLMESGLFSEGENTWADRILNTDAATIVERASGTMSAVEIYEGAGDETILVHIKEVRNAEPKSLIEARGQVIAAYQDYLEAEWIAELRGNTPVEVNSDLLHNLAD